MKVFLMCSIIGMLAAGIYGTVDLTFDIKNGTLIEYQNDEELAQVAQFPESSKGIFKKTNVKVAQREKKIAAPPTLVNTLGDLSIESFSRGEPPMYYETMLMDRVGKPDSVESADVSAAINDTIAAVNQKIKSDSAAAKKEERKFSLKLYSRGRPHLVAKAEETSIESDSSKTH